MSVLEVAANIEHLDKASEGRARGINLDEALGLSAKEPHAR